MSEALPLAHGFLLALTIVIGYLFVKIIVCIDIDMVRKELLFFLTLSLFSLVWKRAYSLEE